MTERCRSARGNVDKILLVCSKFCLLSIESAAVDFLQNGKTALDRMTDSAKRDQLQASRHL